jgi:hypothetical protein
VGRRKAQKWKTGTESRKVRERINGEVERGNNGGRERWWERVFSAVCYNDGRLPSSPVSCSGANDGIAPLMYCIFLPGVKSEKIILKKKVKK